MRPWPLGWPLAWGGCALLLASLAVEQGPKCSVNQYKQGKRCCSKCPPGQKVEVDCSEESNTTCRPCDSGQFQDGWTLEKHCTPHTYCDQNAGFVVHTAGNAEQNAVCRCKKGTHCSSPECQTCRQNTPCGQGRGVLQEASPVADTVCADCPDGFFSNVSSATATCQPWSSCKDKDQKASGTRTSDAVCGDDAPLPIEEAKRTRLLPLLVVPLAVLVLVVCVIVLQQQRRKGRQELPQIQVQQPAEVDYDEECPTQPIQETLLGGQPVVQEDGKDSRLAEQEQV